MQPKLSKYLATETIGSAIVNIITNSGFAYLIYHGRPRIPSLGHGGLIEDSIGQTFIITFLCFLIPSILTRKRRYAGTHSAFVLDSPAPDGRAAVKSRDLYLRSFIAGVVFTVIAWALNAFLMPRVFPDGLSFGHTVIYKTAYGVVVALIATALALSMVLREPE